MEGRLGHQLGDRPVQFALLATVEIGNQAAQVAQGEDALRALLGIDDDDAADLLFVHQFHGLAQRQIAQAADRLTRGQFVQTGIQRILRAQVLGGAQLQLLVDLIKQAADAAQGEIAERHGQGKQAGEGGLVELQAEAVFGGDVRGTGGAFTEQGGQREALAGTDLEGVFLGDALLPGADHAALLDDMKVADRPLLGADDDLAGGMEDQAGLLQQKRQMGGVHLVEGRVFAQELKMTLQVLLHGQLAEGGSLRRHALGLLLVPASINRCGYRFH